MQFYDLSNYKYNDPRPKVRKLLIIDEIVYCLYF